MSLETEAKLQADKIGRAFGAECNINYFPGARTSKDVFYGTPLVCISINKMVPDEKGELWRYNKGSIGYDVKVYYHHVKVEKYQPKEQGDITCAETVKTIEYDAPNTKLGIVKQSFNIIDLVQDVIEFDTVKNESITRKLSKVIDEAEENEAKYYYIVDANYSVPGHYWNDDIKAYTPEGDRDGYDGQETSKLYTWDDLLWALDDELLLTDDVPDEAPTEILKEENGHKVLVEFDVEREQEWDDEEGHFEIRYYDYEVQICIKE